MAPESYITNFENNCAKLKAFMLILAVAAMGTLNASADAADKTSASIPTDAQIAQIVLTADTVDVDYGKLAVEKTEIKRQSLRRNDDS